VTARDPPRQSGHPAVPRPRDPGDDLARGPSARTDPLAAYIEQTYDAATGKPPARVLQPGGNRAVAGLSGHLAAMRRAVYPVARRRLGENQHLLTECNAEAREAEWALRLLECHLSGEAAAAGREFDTVHMWLRQCLDAYQAAERALVGRVEERLTAPEREQLAPRIPRRARPRPQPPAPARGRTPAGPAGSRSGCTPSGTECSTPSTHDLAWPARGDPGGRGGWPVVHPSRVTSP